MKKLIYSLLIALFCAGCSEDFLDISDPNSLNKDIYFNSVDDIDNQLITLYSNLHSISFYGKRFNAFIVGNLDKTFDHSFINDPNRNELFQNNITSQNGLVNDLYRDLFKGIGIANDLLENVELLRQKDIPEADREQLVLIEAQAKFLRGFFYFNIVNLWGRRPVDGGYDGSLGGVPLVTSPIKTRAGFNQPVATNGEVYAQIISDFKDAEDVLPEVWPSTDVARVTKWAAKGLLGKTYLFMEDYNNAKLHLKNVIDNSGKMLVDFDVYKDMFSGENEFNDESIFELAFVDNPNAGWGSWDNNSGQMHSMVAGYWVFEPGNPLKAGQTGWNNVYVHDANLTEFGFELADTPDSPQELQSSEYIQKMKDEIATSDPRIRVNFLIPMIDTLNWANGEKRIVARYGVEQLGDYNWMPGERHAWSIRKYSTITNSVYAYRVQTGENMYLMRLADVYLLYAEAALQTGDEPGARFYINEVRARAYGNHDQDISSSGAQLLEDLKQERFVELFGEGHRWFDIVRWGDGPDMMQKFESGRAGQINFTAPRSYFLPFPLREIETNQALKQHPEYGGEG
ncbi:MAG: RagB/SusD family nutrient uptake outer membrane protein [Cyclobacteriaceae bacterium]